MNDEPCALVMDNGSSLCKVGLAGEDLPMNIFPMVVARQNNQNLVGLKAQEQQLVTNLEYPIDRGIITDWDDMNITWSRVDPKEHPILMSEAPLNPKANREKMTEVMFETFESPAMYLANHAVLSLYSSARLTGAAVDSGDGASHVVPVYEGYALPHATMKYDVAGRDLTSYMQRLLAGSDSHSLPLTSAKEIKERLCRVAQDFELESCPEEFSSHLSYTLPDGKVVRIGSETLQCPEVMFRPSLLGQHTTTGGFHQIVVNSIMKCDKDIREELFANIHLSGGNTLFPGMADRMLKELTALPPPEMEAKMIVSEDPQNSAWIGGSILASMPVFQEIWVSMKEYDEDGPAVIHRKCF